MIMLLSSLVACDRYECEPAPQVDGSRSGFEACRKHDGRFAYLNREAAVACSGDPLATVPACLEDYGGDCTTDDECSDGDVCGQALSGWADCACLPVCGSDADCGTDEACVCALTPIPSGEHGMDVYAARTDVCVTAQCRSDADCESGECGALIGPCGDAVLGFYCRTKDDECRGNYECGNIGWCGPPDGGGKWTCSSLGNCD